uniref:B12-binding domain-containing protein n=1 Tax=Parascaris univalens TaxID=6257 RepID=A0A915BTB9_PARUN
FLRKETNTDHSMLTTFLYKYSHLLLRSRLFVGAPKVSKQFICAAFSSSKIINDVLSRVKVFAKREGRQPRILLSRMDKNSLGINTTGIAVRFADLGFDVDLGPQHLSPEETAQQSVNADVHVVGVCNVATEYITSVLALRRELERLGRPDILVIASGPIPKEHHEALYAAGVFAVFTHEGDIPYCVLQALDQLETLLPSDDSTICSA